MTSHRDLKDDESNNNDSSLTNNNLINNSIALDDNNTQLRGAVVAKGDDEENAANKLVQPQRGPLQVTMATSWRRNFEEDYKMTSPLRGYCLIVNNVDFDMDVFPQRKGSDKDAWRFKTIFTQMGFEADVKRNVNSEKMKSLCRQKATLCLNKHDALVVILLSHGTECGIYGTDGIEVDLNDILSYFDNKKCKAMRGKPKVFIVQACRGRQTDYGVKETQNVFISQPDSQPCSLPSQLTQINTQMPKMPRWAEVDSNHQPTRTDMVLCFASQSGYVSTRNEEDGSWLGDSLAYHLATCAHQRHLHDIFNMVSRDVRKRRSTDGLKQVLEVTSIGFDKNLYFNPGLSDSG